MTGARIDRADPMFRPLSIPEAMAYTGRSRKTIDRWIAAGMLRTVKLGYPPQTVVIEGEALEVEAEMRRRAQANRDRIAAAAGRRGPRKPPETRSA